MRNFRSSFMLLLMFMLLIAASAFAATPRYEGKVKAAPAGIDLPTYPILMGDPDAEDQVSMKLHLSRLGSQGEVMLNFNRARGAFELDRVSGYVYDNEKGVHIYLKGCGNRLVSLPIRPACEKATPNPDPAPKPEPGLIRRAWNFLTTPWRLFWQEVNAWPYWWHGRVTMTIQPNGYTVETWGNYPRVTVTPQADGRATFDVR